MGGYIKRNRSIIKSMQLAAIPEIELEKGGREAGHCVRLVTQ